MSKVSYSKLDLHNKNGSELCHWIGCRKHKRLYQGFRGKFCKRHLDELTKLRQELKESDVVIRDEIDLRYKEALWRKRMDKGHMYYILALEKRQDPES